MVPKYKEAKSIWNVYKSQQINIGWAILLLFVLFQEIPPYDNTKTDKYANYTEIPFWLRGKFI